MTMTSRPRVFLPPNLPVFLQLIDLSFDTGIAAHTCYLGLRTAVLRMKKRGPCGFATSSVPSTNDDGNPYPGLGTALLNAKTTCVTLLRPGSGPSFTSGLEPSRSESSKAPPS